MEDDFEEVDFEESPEDFEEEDEEEEERLISSGWVGVGIFSCWDSASDDEEESLEEEVEEEEEEEEEEDTGGSPRVWAGWFLGNFSVIQDRICSALSSGTQSPILMAKRFKPTLARDWKEESRRM